MIVTPEHLSQFKAMLETCEVDFEQYLEDGVKTVIELYNGTRFIFDPEGMLADIEY